jgi:pimeloyl-ACP methyl ester carboxylesterase
MAIAKAGEINLEYFTEGSGPPLLLVMGFAGSAYTWGQPFIEALKRSFTVTRFSNRGTGGSDRPDAQTTIRMMADDTVALLDALGIERPHVMGISMGGYIAQELAINYPGRVNGLVLGCTGVGGPTAVQSDPQTMQSMAFDPSLPIADLVRKSWYALVSDGFVSSGHDFLETMLSSILEHPTPMETIMKQVMAIAGHNVAERDKAITAPTLVIHGDADRLVPPANGDQVAAAISGAQKHTIHGVGHMFFWEKPEESARIVTEFLSRVPAGM